MTETAANVLPAVMGGQPGQPRHVSFFNATAWCAAAVWTDPRIFQHTQVDTAAEQSRQRNQHGFCGRPCAVPKARRFVLIGYLEFWLGAGGRPMTNGASRKRTPLPVLTLTSRAFTENRAPVPVPMRWPNFPSRQAPPQLAGHDLCLKNGHESATSSVLTR